MFETLAAGLAAACAMAITEAPRETDCGALQRNRKSRRDRAKFRARARQSCSRWRHRLRWSPGLKSS
jgi:hypothetical protein